MCLNKPFKAVLRRCWVKYVASAVESFPDANSDSSFKLPVPTRQNMIDWVKEGYDSLVQDQEMVKKSFEVCGISSTDTISKLMRAMTLMKILSNCTISRPS